MKKKYGSLYNFINKKLKKEDCDNTLRFAKEFAEKHDIFFGELSQMLEDCGGHCDCEVLLNATNVISDNEIIGEEKQLSPKQFAIKHGLYCNCLVNGEPASPQDAMEAGKSGNHVRLWVPCEKEAPFAVPDLNNAMLRMDEEKT